MLIDTGNAQPEIYPTTAGIDAGQAIGALTEQRAQNIFNKINSNIWAHEDADALDDYWQAETLSIDAIHLFDGYLSEELNDAYETQRACLSASLHRNSQAENARAAQPSTPNAQNGNNDKGNNMFDFDQGAQGGEGPWISWSARGTLDGAIPRASFFLRDGDTKTVMDAFNTGVVLDIETMKTGWQKSDGVAGQAPDWKWNPSISAMQPQPDEDFKKGFEIRCAIGGGEAATWQQAGAGAWNTFTNLVPALQQGQAGKLPLVKLVGTKDVQFKRGSTTEAILEVVEWVDRPDCLKPDFQKVDTGEPTAGQVDAAQRQAAATAQTQAAPAAGREF